MANFEIFRLICLAGFAFLLGFFSAIPIGAAQIEAAKRALHDHLLSAFVVIIGAVSADLIYGCIAFFGIAPFLEHKTVVAIFKLACVIILWALAFLTIKQSAKPHLTHMEMAILQSKRVAFVTGFLLGISNPFMIVWWLISAKIIRDIGIIKTFHPATSFIFLLFTALGVITYLGSLCIILHRAHKFISHKAIQRLNIAMGIVLIILSLYFLTTALKILLA